MLKIRVKSMRTVAFILLYVTSLKAFGATSGLSILDFLSLIEEKGLGLLAVVGLLIFVIFKTQKIEYIEKLLSNHITDTNKKIDQQREDFSSQMVQQREDSNKKFDQQRADFKEAFVEIHKKVDQQREDFNSQMAQQREDSNKKFDQQREDFNSQMVQQREDSNKKFDQQRADFKESYTQIQHELHEVRKDIKQILEKISS